LPAFLCAARIPTGHLEPLRAFLPAAALRAADDEALREGYLWHEFGDVCLIAPRLDSPPAR
jgi:hypothetical protein